MVKMLTVLVSTISNSQVFLLKNVSSFCKCNILTIRQLTTSLVWKNWAQSRKETGGTQAKNLL